MVNFYDIYIEHAKLTSEFVFKLNKKMRHGYTVFGCSDLSNFADGYSCMLRFVELDDLHAALVYYEILRMLNKTFKKYGTDWYNIYRYCSINSLTIDMDLTTSTGLVLISKKYHLDNGKFSLKLY